MCSRLRTLSLTVLVCMTFSLYTADPGDNDMPLSSYYELAVAASSVEMPNIAYPNNSNMSISFYWFYELRVAAPSVERPIGLYIKDEKLLLPSLSKIGKNAQEDSGFYNLKLFVYRPHIPDPYFANGFISDDNMKVLGDHLTALSALDISDNSFTKNGALVLATALNKNTTLTTLKMANLKNDPDAFPPLMQALYENTTLTKLNIEGNALSGSPVQALAPLLSKPWCAVKTLDLGRTFINDDDVDNLCVNLLYNNTLKNLKLDRNSLSNTSMRSIGACLMRNSTLQLLDISDNSYEDNKNDYVGPTALAVSLSKNISLTKLHMRENHVDDRGAFAFAELLKDNSTLKDLHLRGNCITDQGALALLQSAKMCNQVLEIVDLSYNKIQDKAKTKSEIDQLITPREKELKIIWETPIAEPTTASKIGKNRNWGREVRVYGLFLCGVFYPCKVIKI